MPRKLNYGGVPMSCTGIFLRLGESGYPALQRRRMASGRGADLGHSAEFTTSLWRDFRNVVKTANPDALILAEHYGDASSWLSGDQGIPSVNYDAFMEPVSFFLTGMGNAAIPSTGERWETERFLRVP